MIVQIDRTLSIPIYTQIVGQLQFSIVSGRLPSGTQLPSIRELSQESDIAPMTVSQAYQELKRLGLIDMQVGRGTFVTAFSLGDDLGADGLIRPNRTLRLRRILQGAVAEAATQGFSEDEIKGVFLSVLTDSQGVEMDHMFVMAGLWQHALEVYADDIERRLAADRVVVNPITFADLRERPAYYQPWLERADALFVPVHQVLIVQELLGAAGLVWNKPILGLNFVVRSSTAEAIGDLPGGLRLGLISKLPEFVNSLVQGVEALYPLTQPPWVGLTDDEAALAQMAQSAQAIVFASGCEEAIAHLRRQMPPNTPMIEYLHTPDEAAYARIQSFLTRAAAPLPA